MKAFIMLHIIQNLQSELPIVVVSTDFLTISQNDVLPGDSKE